MEKKLASRGSHQTVLMCQYKISTYVLHILLISIFKQNHCEDNPSQHIRYLCMCISTQISLAINVSVRSSLPGHFPRYFPLWCFASWSFLSQSFRRRSFTPRLFPNKCLLPRFFPSKLPSACLSHPYFPIVVFSTQSIPVESFYTLLFSPLDVLYCNLLSCKIRHDLGLKL